MTPGPPPETAATPAAPPRAPGGLRRPDVSVCVVNWNCRDLLRACLRSLDPGRQGVRLEVIVVDNASTDGAAEMVAQEFPEVVLIRNAVNVGFAPANNQAAAAARGRYLFFLNNDTVVSRGALRRLCAYARAHPEVGLLGPRLSDSQGRPQGSYRRRPSLRALLHRISLFRAARLFRGAHRRYRARDGDFRTTRPVEVLMGAALFMPRRVFRECGPWDEGYIFGGEDIDLCTRVGRRYAVVYHPEVEVTHVGRASSRLRVGYAYTHTVVGILRYLRKSGCPRPALLLYKAAFTLDAPLQWLVHFCQYWWRRARGRPATAASSRLVFQGVGHFLTRGLLAFWKA